MYFWPFFPRKYSELYNNNIHRSLSLKNVYIPFKKKSAEYVISKHPARGYILLTVCCSYLTPWLRGLAGSEGEVRCELFCIQKVSETGSLILRSATAATAAALVRRSLSRSLSSSSAGPNTRRRRCLLLTSWPNKVSTLLYEFICSVVKVRKSFCAKMGFIFFREKAVYYIWSSKNTPEMTLQFFDFPPVFFFLILFKRKEKYCENYNDLHIFYGEKKLRHLYHLLLQHWKEILYIQKNYCGFCL